MDVPLVGVRLRQPPLSPIGPLPNVDHQPPRLPSSKSSRTIVPVLQT